MINRTLEQKTKEIDWREFIPIYGIYHRIINQEKTKPHTTDEISRGYATYQTVSTIASGLGLYKLGEIIFK